MTENEYIDATNLAKLRIIGDVLRDFTSKGYAVDDNRISDLLSVAANMVQEHYDRIKTEG